MILYRRTILTALFTFCLCCFLTNSAKAKFKWKTVSYKGKECVTLKSVQKFYYFKRTIKGNKITLESKKFKMQIRTGSQECRMNGVLFILSHPIIAYKGDYLISRTDLINLLDPVMRPAYIKHRKMFNTVVLDAGHGGKDSGSLGHYKNEKYYTLKVARLTRDMLKRLGYRVVMTRNSDQFISLANRVSIANRYPNAIFVSIHFNSGQSKAHGVETFTISPVGVPHMGRNYETRDARSVPGNMMESARVALATAIHSRTLLYLNKREQGNKFNIKDRGIKHARFNVLTNIKIPAILIEGGFLSNRSEAKKVNSLTYQKTLARAIVRGIYLYRRSLSQK